MGNLKNAWEMWCMGNLVHVGTCLHTVPRHNFFTEASLIAAWEIWKMRKDKVFERRELCNFKNQCFLQSKSISNSLVYHLPSFKIWQNKQKSISNSLPK
jgi:hypothetical protein